MNRMLRLVARRARTLWQDSAGVAAVETVLIAPFAILVLCVGIEGGHFLYSEHQVLKGVRDASRFASRLPLSTWNCTTTTGDADLSSGSAAWQSIANVAVYGNVAGGSRARLWTWSAASDDGEITIRFACIAKTTGIYGGFAPQITVIGKPNYPSLFKTMGGFNASLTLYAREQAVGIGI